MVYPFPDRSWLLFFDYHPPKVAVKYKGPGLEQILPVWLVYLLFISLLMAGAALFSRFVFAPIERREEVLGERNRDRFRQREA